VRRRDLAALPSAALQYDIESEAFFCHSEWKEAPHAKTSLCAHTLCGASKAEGWAGGEYVGVAVQAVGRSGGWCQVAGCSGAVVSGAGEPAGAACAVQVGG
jgi:hypothetical protein